MLKSRVYIQTLMETEIESNDFDYVRENMESFDNYQTIPFTNEIVGYDIVLCCDNCKEELFIERDSYPYKEKLKDYVERGDKIYCIKCSDIVK